MVSQWHTVAHFWREPGVAVKVDWNSMASLGSSNRLTSDWTSIVSMTSSTRSLATTTKTLSLHHDSLIVHVHTPASRVRRLMWPFTLTWIPTSFSGLIWGRSYCWWLKSCTTWDVWNPINNGINYLSTGAGFQPSTVDDLFPCQRFPCQRFPWPCFMFLFSPSCIWLMPTGTVYNT